jgi:hypothetical protein
LPVAISASATTMTATVPMCQKTDALLSSATIRIPATLRKSWIASSPAMVSNWPLTSDPATAVELPKTIPKLARIGVTMAELTNEAAA